MVEEHRELVTEFIESDPKGYFIIKLDTARKEIIADHYGNDNILLNRITGSKAKYIHKRITSLGLVSNLSHAAYLGHELRAAQFALEHGLPYEQDREMLLMPKERLSDVSLAAEATYVKAGRLVSIPGRSHEENVKVGQVEMPFKDFLRSRGLSRVF
ncbi:MAG: hypothetical protein FJY76_00720 [Candidatus Aenigmarchaeota archaeon]|nr:hypothetical protein [Candidatus Aenigmarchaeota archaeon]